jgi:FixJ family two-component response regulator
MTQPKHRGRASPGIQPMADSARTQPVAQDPCLTCVIQKWESRRSPASLRRAIDGLSRDAHSRPVATLGDHIVFVVDDDLSFREALCGLLASLQFRVAAFGSAAEYFAFPKPDLPACLILDVKLPDTNGLDIQCEIANRPHPPIIFVTAHGDIPSAVRAIKLGAVEFLTKPCGKEQLIQTIHAAIDLDRRSRLERGELVELQHRLSRLTPREREVLPLIVSGLLNKQAAAELGISEITLQIHRGKIMQKMEAPSLADLVRMAERLQIPVTHSRQVTRRYA